MQLNLKLKSLLIESGLSETEAVIYTELLQKPAEKKWELVTRTGLDKNAVYRAFERLENLKLIAKGNKKITANSLRSLVSDLKTSILKQKKIANKIQNLAPYLHLPSESIDSIETFYTRDQIIRAYLFMSDHDYNYNLEFGDFENFVSVLGSLAPPIQFRNIRVKHAATRAICTTFGRYSAFFANKHQREKFNIDVNRLNLDFKGSFIQFSDDNDYVLFNNFSDPDNYHSVLIKSKTIADIQRRQFDCFSQLVEK